MDFDLATHLGAISRRVETLQYQGIAAKAVVLSRVYPTDADDLWEALTTPDRLRRWFLPVSGDLKLNGRYQFEGNAGGVITVCEPPRRLEATWEFAGGKSWVIATLAPEGQGTRFELRHIAPVDDHWKTFGPGAVGVGWDLGFLGLARHVDAPEAARPPEANPDWMASPEALALYRSTSTAWADAAIADGEDEATARQSAERTRKFYSGEPTTGD